MPKGEHNDSRPRLVQLAVPLAGNWLFAASIAVAYHFYYLLYAHLFSLNNSIIVFHLLTAYFMESIMTQFMTQSIMT